MHYLVSVIAEGDPEATSEEMEAISAFNVKLEAAGHRLFAGGLGANDTATTIDNRGSELLITDGPFIETKEFIAGLWIWDVPDLDVALALAEEASKACNRKIEVRPFLVR